MGIHALLMVAAGMVTGENPPDGVKPKDWPYYERVQAVGTLHSPRGRSESMTIQVPTVPKPTPLPLDISQLKNWSEERFRKANAKDVRATGTLELKPVGARPNIT